MDCIMNQWDDKQCLTINNTALSEILKRIIQAGDQNASVYIQITFKLTLL